MIYAKIFKASAIVMIMILSSGCSLKVTSTPFSAGSILVMPPSNAVQGGKVHPVAMNSGVYLQQALVQQLDGRGALTAKAYTADTRFSNTTEYDISDAAQVASSSGYRYCLVAKLGEFRDAAAMTFRDDFATLNEARLIDAQSRQEVWSLRQPYRASGGNIGSYYPLLDQIAAKIAKSIIKSSQSGGKSSQSVSKQGQPLPSMAPTISSPPASNKEASMDQNFEKLRLLKNAREQGILSEAEYQQKKRKVVDAL